MKKENMRYYIIACFMIMVAAPAQVGAATMQEIENQLRRLHQDVADMQQFLYRSDISDNAAFSPIPSSTQLSKTTVRIDEMQDLIQQLNGSIEEMNFVLERKTAQINKMLEDIDYRLKKLEEVTPEKIVQDEKNVLKNDTEQKKNTIENDAVSSSSAAKQDESKKQQKEAAKEQEPIDLQKSPFSTAQEDDIAVTRAQGLTAEQLYEKALQLWKQSKYQSAAQHFKAFIEEHEGHALSSNAHYWLGESYYAQKSFQQAARHFLQVYQKYGTTNKVPDSLLKLAMSLNQLEKNKEACFTLQKLGEEFPSQPDTIRQKATSLKENIHC